VSRQRDRAWADYSEHFRREVFPHLVSSAVSVSIVGGGRNIDAKQAAELGAILLLDKPLIVVCVPGATISSRLRRAADVVIEDWSPDNQAAQDQLAAAVKRLGIEVEGSEP
jgi:hypothetical protein